MVESLKHAGFHHGADVEIVWIQSESVEGLLAAGQLNHLDGIVIPGGFGYRGVEGKIAAARYAREEGVPCLGLCLGLQAMTIEFARDVVGLTDANSTEFDPTTHHPVIDLMLEQRGIEDKGGTMRLGACTTPCSHPARRWPRRTGNPSSASGTAIATSSTSATANNSRTPVCGARARRPTIGSSSSSNSRATRSGSARRLIPSSRAGRIAHIRCSAS